MTRNPKRTVERAVEMLRLASEMIREHCPEAEAFYDETDCDGLCVADDCEFIADDLAAIFELKDEGK
jgi:hypothetical protein